MAGSLKAQLAVAFDVAAVGSELRAVECGKEPALAAHITAAIAYRERVLAEFDELLAH